MIIFLHCHLDGNKQMIVAIMIYRYWLDGDDISSSDKCLDAFHIVKSMNFVKGSCERLSSQNGDEYGDQINSVSKQPNK